MTTSGNGGADNGLGRFTIKRAMLGFGALLFAILVFMGLFTHSMIAEIRVGGPFERQLAQGREFFADIIPAALTPSEAYALALAINDDPEKIAALAPHIEKLH